MDARAEREALRALLAAIEEPARAAALPSDAGVIALARRHRLTPLLSSLEGVALPPALSGVARTDRIATTARNLMFAEVAAEAARALLADGIDVIVLKGLAYEATLYGKNGCRPTSDVDLLVPGEKRRAAFATLDRLGYEPRAAAPGFDEPDYHEVAWNRNGVELDLHLGLAPTARCTIDYAAVWSARVPFDLPGVTVSRLADDHAAAFHALHMAIDHFDVPALSLVDLARLLPDAVATARARDTARDWRVGRPFETALSLAATFLPIWAATSGTTVPGQTGRSERIVASYGGLARLPRAQQLRRKLEHFDHGADAVRYLVVQARRNVRELWEGRLKKRSARARLALSPRGP
ncbi:MAG: hypothetical protein JWM82_351 [Myxococcales bacterium]|nr:hypothetical protein [Myxococcales bacterium]